MYKLMMFLIVTKDDLESANKQIEEASWDGWYPKNMVSSGEAIVLLMHKHDS